MCTCLCCAVVVSAACQVANTMMAQVGATASQQQYDLKAAKGYKSVARSAVGSSTQPCTHRRSIAGSRCSTSCWCVHTHHTPPHTTNLCPNHNCCCVHQETSFCARWSAAACLARSLSSALLLAVSGAMKESLKYLMCGSSAVPFQPSPLLLLPLGPCKAYTANNNSAVHTVCQQLVMSVNMLLPCTTINLQHTWLCPNTTTVTVGLHLVILGTIPPWCYCEQHLQACLNL